MDQAPGPTLVTTVVGLRVAQGRPAGVCSPSTAFHGLYPGPGAPGDSQSPRAQADAYWKGLEPGREGGREAQGATAASQVAGVLKPDTLLCALLEGWRLSGQNAHSVNSAIVTTLKWKGVVEGEGSQSLLGFFFFFFLVEYQGP